MTTQQVAERYYELAKQKKWAELVAELYSNDIVNREPEHAISIGIPTVTRGMEAVNAKSLARREMIQEIHDQFCSAPIVAGNFFTLSMGRDITYKGKPRIKVEEIAVFEVKEGRIVLEQFFY